VDTTVTTIPIIIRVESLAGNTEKSPSCWQMARYRLRKTRGEF
jgi:hypothetical protein